MASDLRAGAARGDHSRADLAVQVIISRRGLALYGMERRQLAQAFILAGRSIEEVIAARLSGDFSDLETLPITLTRLDPGERTRPKMISTERAAKPDAADEDSPTTQFSVMSSRFLA